VSAFIHLHVHSEFSLREGAARMDDCIAFAREQGMFALAITDTNALYGAVAFYRKSKKAGIRPIIGVQLTVARVTDAAVLEQGRPGGPATDSAVLLAENYEGYQNLVKLVTLAQTRTRQPFVTFDEVKLHTRHVIALIGGGESEILRQFATGQDAVAENWLRAWKETFSQDLYVDVQDHAIPIERQALPALIRAARMANLPLVATNDVHYVNPEDMEIQHVLAQLEGPGQALLQGDKYHLASAEEMARRFAKLPEAMANTVKIAERCNIEMPIGQALLPKYPIPDGETSDGVLRRAAEFGAKQRYGNLTDEVTERLSYELSVIERLGFADYFLVVADFIRFAHKKHISTGPGRGSAAGSLVAYTLRITDVDPLHHRLLFERFLNPDRVSWPDIDTDFEYERRSEVIEYVVARYGASHVAQIGTFGTLAARAAIRDAGRVLGTDAKAVDKLAKLIPSYPGVTLAQAHQEVATIGHLLDNDPGLQELWETACGLEGFPRHTSVHAAGVIISPIPLADIVPVQPGSDGVPVTQYPMDDIEYLGLIKMDFLGLRTLTLIDACVASIERRTGQKLDWRQTSETDEKTFAMLSRGETEGCFQLESSGVRRVLRDLKPTTMEDIIAVISLYRPGPMENIPTFIASKHGRKAIQYPHEDLAPILRDTYGVIVYQEQIIQIASLMAGFSLGQADLLRRAVSKKKRDVLDAERSRFVEGATAKGYKREVADDVYDLIVRFADYGFNRSHAAAYAVLAYRTSYLRANHMADFLAALLSMVISSADKTDEYLRDAKKHGIQVLPPSIVESEALYSATASGAIRSGLLAVRNVGRGAVEAILNARQNAPYTSLVDFLQRLNPRACNRKSVESLLTTGALGDFLPTQITAEVAAQILQEAYDAVPVKRSSQGADGFERGTGDIISPGKSGQASRVGLKLQFDDSPDVLFVRYDSTVHGTEVLTRVRQTLMSYGGATKVALVDSATQKLRMLENKWAVSFSVDLISALEEYVGIGNAKLGKVPKKRKS